MLEQIEKGPIPMKKTIKVQFRAESTPLYFSSMFDSGNMEKVQIGLNNTVIITPGNDCSGSAYESHAKGWFYFSVKGGENHSKLKLVIRKLSQLSSQNKISEYFKPVYRYEKEEWQRVENARTVTKQDDTQLQIQFELGMRGAVYFAYTYPFSYEDCEKMLSKWENEAKKHKSIYYCDQILIKSPEGRNVHFLTVTENEGITEETENIEDKFLFQESKQRAVRFEGEKRVVMISARVHPAETPSSHTFNGLVKFLLSKYLSSKIRDARAHYLRKNFIFKLVPMLNPDGVANGHYRMDVFNQNLNRYYQNPDPLLQPSAYAVKQIGKHYSSSSKNKLCFYMDLHAHPQRKGNFIYGNNFESPEVQIQSQLFAKILSLNCIEFDYENSSFEEKHMTLKDKNQNLTKEGCGRVVFQKEFNLTYSYTMECGYTASSYLNQIVGVEKAHRKFEKLSIIPDEMENIKSPYYSVSNKKGLTFTIQAYENLGKNVLVSILDIFHLNPASRIPNTQYKAVEGIKKEIGFQLNKSKEANFRKYLLKPTSQQSIKSRTAQQEQSKTIHSLNIINSLNSVNNLSGSVKSSQKQIVGSQQTLEKKNILVTSQFMFLQHRTLLEGKEKKAETETQRRKNSLLPKVNLFKLNNAVRSIKDVGKVM